MKNRAKWQIKQYRDKEDPTIDSYSITLDSQYEGWRTDSGYNGYGLPKKLAEWICNVLNESEKECPFLMKYGMWNEK